MFTKILIANRGEIACRVIRTARRMGIATVAVYSDADAGALHVSMADEAVRLGPPPAVQSYLLADAIVAACQATGAQAVHPGYGFLSERTSFAAALDAAGIAFIGPPASAIAAMGDKIESKKLARAAGVSVVPGFVGEIEDADHAARIAGEIGYPVMMKASAGGGGKGMRLAFSEDELREGYQSVRNEALASFGDDRLFIEKFVTSPRHIEIQLIGDQHGNLLYLNERECSVQRRHQKVIEEAPSPFVTPEMRRAMGEQSVALARAVGYTSAGTVEFIVGADRSFYFLEMNTRLQVEHPVTEMTTGLDLVELMIRVAAGEALPLKQDQVPLNGWSMETRVYAEDPYRGFLPSIGRLSTLRQPREDATTRIDTGVIEGAEISIYYDPLIAKLITHGPTREAAIDAQIAAIDGYVIRGVGHNLDFLSAVMQHPRFRAGNLTTGFIAEEYPDGFHGAPVTPDTARTLVAVAATAHARVLARAGEISGKLNGHGPDWGDQWAVFLGGARQDVRVIEAGEFTSIEFDGVSLRVESAWCPGDVLFRAEIDGADVTIAVERVGIGYRLTTRGAKHIVRVLTPRAADLQAHMIVRPPADTSRLLLSPMPGLLTDVRVSAGDKVEAGQPVAVVEAMKMENILRAPRAATVKAVLAGAGASVAADEVILEFE